MWVLVTLGVILVGLTHWFLNRSFGHWKKRGVPSPPTRPLVGNLGPSLIMTKSLGQIYTEIYNNYKGYLYVGVYKLQTPALLLRDVELIKTITIKDFASFHDNDIEINDSIDPIFAKNPFSLKGHMWKVVRSQVTSAITTSKIKNMFALMSNVGKNLVTYLNTEPEAQGNDGLETKELAAKFTTDVVAACAFGLEGNSFTNPDSDFRKMGRKFFNTDFWTALKFTLVFISPSLTSFLRLKAFPDEVRDWFTGILTETINHREKNNIKRNDYLDLMLSLKTKPGEYEFTNDDVMAQSMTFYADGYETSSVALSLALYEIAKNPDVQNKLRQEVDTVLPKHGDEVTYEAIQEMNYLDMVLSETLRMYPPGMFLAKSCTKTYTFSAPKGQGTGSSVTVHPGTPVIIPIYGIHHDPIHYPDPEKFDPERFTEEAKTARPSGTYMPFGEGPRMCLGFRFAVAQVKAAIASVVSNFDIKVNPKTTPTFEMEPQYIMIAKKGGVWLNYYKRSK